MKILLALMMVILAWCSEAYSLSGSINLNNTSIFHDFQCCARNDKGVFACGFPEGTCEKEWQKNKAKEDVEIIPQHWCLNYGHYEPCLKEESRNCKCSDTDCYCEYAKEAK